MLKNFDGNISWLLARWKISMMCALVVCLISCDKDNDLELLNLKNSALTVSYVLNGTAISLNGQTYSMTKNYVPIAIKLAKEGSGTDTVFATVNPSLINDYNKAHNETNEVVASTAFQVSHKGAFPVAANSSQATDSLYVLLTDASALKDKGVYLVPVELKAKSGAALQNPVIYFKVFVNKGELSARFTGASYRSYVYPFYQYGSLRLNYDRIQRNVIPDEVQFGVNINTPFVYNNVNVSAEYAGDAASVAYATKLSAYPVPIPLPADTYTISTNVATVTKGAYVATDSIKVTFKNKEKILSLTPYILGIKVKRLSNSPYSVSPALNDSSTTFIRIYSY